MKIVPTITAVTAGLVGIFCLVGQPVAAQSIGKELTAVNEEPTIKKELADSAQFRSSFVHFEGSDTTPDSLSFQSIRISLGPTFISYSNHVDGWNPAPGLGLTAHTPFNGGELLLGASAVRWNAHQSFLPDFIALHFFGGFTLSTPPTYPVKISSGLKVGNYFMAFNSNQVAGERNESELSVSLMVSIRRTFWDKIEGFVEGEATRVFTLPNIDFMSVRLGLSLTLKAPPWLETIAR